MNPNVDFTQTTSCLEWCAGYGGIFLGLKRAIPSLRTIAFGEIEAFAVANLVAKMEAGLLDPAPIWTDLKTFPCERFRDRVDILVAGYPCQPFSAAGKRLGTEDPRHLWPFIARAIRVIRPRLCFLENVEGHITLGLSTVISDLEELGYKVAWGIFSASEVGAPHQRKRVFILAYDQRKRVEELSRQIAVGSKQHSAWDDGSIAWPSRPGESQHEWEPPRVVGGLANTASTRSWSEGGDPIHKGWVSSDARATSVSQDTERQTGAAIADDQPAGRDGGELENTTSERPRTLGAEPTGQQWEASASSAGDAMGHTNSPRPQERPGQRGAGIQGADADGREDSGGQTQPSLGGDADGPAGGLGYAELCVSCDNRTDELRLLGNGVVPTTAERAFRVLSAELLTADTQ